MGTLVWDPFFTEMAPFFGLTFEELLEQKHPTNWIEYECGRITEDELLADFFLDRRPVDGTALRETMRSHYDWLPGIETLLGDLAGEGAEMHLLSNYPEWYTMIEEKLEISRFAPWTFVSWHTGLHKPDPAVYVHAAQILGRRPEECVFVDDREINCDGARSVGMQAIRYTNTEELRADLTQRSILPE